MKLYIKLTIVSMALLTLNLTGIAQSYSDGALLFGRTDKGGTARIQALGGAQTALGGDVSLAQTNPAGLGMANRSSFTFSLGMSDYQSTTEYLGNSTRENRFTPNLPQLGVILHTTPSDEDSKFKGGSFGINVNRTADYNVSNKLVGIPEGSNTLNSSLIDYFLYDVDGLPISAFQQGGSEYNSITGLGWYTYLIDTIGGFYDSYILDFPEEQRESVDIRGRQTQWSFSYGGNYNDMIFFGAGIGFTSFNYSSTKLYEEIFPLFDDSIIDGFSLEENLAIDGNGINASLGLIVRPVNVLQLGVSYTTPTRYNIDDNWDANMETIWTNNPYPGTGEQLDVVYEETSLIISDYALTAPSRLNFGAAVFLGKYGFITADYERADFGLSRLNSRDFSMEIDNEEISSIYGSVDNIRVGAELRYDKFRLRGGYSLQGDPYQNNELFDSSITTVSGGVGFMAKSFFADFSLRKSTSESGYFPYVIAGEGNFARTAFSRVNGIITVGFNF